ncbi:MAG TPA: tRNA (adenosine(37)-N6)-threonylcarbamoyltransferase complex ATPase subunit type 1 TsaE [Candidatus Competibacteraceae bacterium]|nr:tRNA (adenosine(37)-N6)-threonylcarbamoyltransferase complex ATPase subunit type 1 TsaE [Candidatus Competibacteraceae bacterium]
MLTTLSLADAQATEALGAALAAALGGHGALLYLQGELGTGKTTLVRGLLRALGHGGAVKSPTYTLVEPYILDERAVYHLDLYRLADPEELEFIGLRDWLGEDALILVEWPERGAGWLPPADLRIALSYAGAARAVSLEALSARGRELLARLAALGYRPES